MSSTKIQGCEIDQVEAMKLQVQQASKLGLKRCREI